jgi:hypothetical protein
LTIKHFVYNVAHNFSGGVAGLAEFMGKGYQVLNNKLNPNSTTHYLTIAELEMLADFTNSNIKMAEYFAHKAGAVVVQLPNLPESDMGLLDLFLSASKEFADISSSFQTAYADGRVDAKEFEVISHEFDEALARIIELKSGIERIVR